MKKLIYIIGYFSLVSPPRAIKLKYHDKDSELQDKPLWLVVVAEFLFRFGLFMLLAAFIEELLGDDLFEHLQSDLFLGALIISGVIHTLVYFVSFSSLAKVHKSKAISIYRLGRNISYSALPGFPIAMSLIVYQDLQKIIFENPHTVQIAFFTTWGIFAMLGIIEWATVKRTPLGLTKHLLRTSAS
jgi:hypothetical protein